MIQHYNRWLKSHPLLANMGTASVVYIIGDVAAQYIETMEARKTVHALRPSPPGRDAVALHTPITLDVDRCEQMVMWSALIYTPIWVQIFRRLDNAWPLASVRHVAAKVMVSTVCNVPSLSLFFLFGVAYPSIQRFTQSEPKNRSMHAIKARAKDIYTDTMVKLSQDLGPTLLAGVFYWWPINAVNFRFTPPHLRPLVMSLFSVAWGCYLSLVQYNDTGKCIE